MDAISTKRKILIVDDIYTNIELLIAILHKAGYDTTYANNGVMALGMIKDNDFDLILLDVLMPLMDGFEVCKQLQSNNRTKEIPVIFLTAKSDTESFAKGLEFGAVDYMYKPFKRQELLAKVRTHIDLKVSKQKLREELAMRKKTEDELRITTERLELAMQVGKLAWWDYDVEEQTMLCSLSESLTDKTPRVVDARNIDDLTKLIHPDHQKRVIDELKLFVEGKKEVFETEYPVEVSKDNYHWFSDVGQIVERDIDGKPLRIVGVVVDITDKKNTRVELERSEFKFRTIANYTFDWEFWLKPSAEFEYVSPACLRISGYTAAEFEQNPSLFFDIVTDNDKEIVGEMVSNILKKSALSDFDFRITTKDGQTKWLSMVAQPVLTDDGTFDGARGSIRDITERKVAEEEIKNKNTELATAYEQLSVTNKRNSDAYQILSSTHNKLRDTQSLYRTLVSNLPQTDVYVFNKDLRLMIVEGGEMRKFGFNSSNFEGSLLHDVIDPDLEPYFTRMFRKALTGDYIAQEYHFLNEWFYHQALPLKKEDGEIFGGLFVSQNISEQKKALKSLSNSELKYRNVVEQAPDGIFNSDMNGLITDVNKSFCKMTGYNREELLGRNVNEIIDGVPQDDFIRSLESLKRGRTLAIEMQLVHNNGKLLPVEINSKILSDNRIQGFVRDIIERKQAEGLLRKSEEKFSKVFMLSPEAILILNAANGLVIDLNKSAQNMLGVERDQLLQRTDEEFGLWKKKSDRSQFYAKVRTHSEITGFEASLIRNDKSYFFGLISGRMIHFNNTDCIITTIQDFTEKKQAEDALRAERLRFLNLLEKFPSFVCLINRTFEIKYANSRFKEIFGDVTMHRCYQGFRKLTTPCQPCLFEEVMRTGGDVSREWTSGDGRTYLIQASHFLNSDNTPLVLEVGLDITDRKLAEEEVKRSLEQVVKYSALKSRIISTVSHEFRTPVTVINSNVQLLERMCAGDSVEVEKLKKNFRRIHEAIHSLTSLLNNAYSVEQDQSVLSNTPELINFDNLCIEIVEELNSIIDNTAEIKLQQRSLVGQVYFDKEIIRHILNNLLTNAQKFSSPSTSIDLILDADPANNIIDITIKDKGIGISAEDQKHIFEPFHRGANAEAIKGSGLGLTIVKRSVDLCGGSIQVTSELNRGTTIKLQLPLMHSKVAPTPPKQ